MHPAGEGLSPKFIRRVVWDVLARLDPACIEQLLPARLDRMSRWDALRQIHFPDSWELLKKARQGQGQPVPEAPPPEADDRASTAREALREALRQMGLELPHQQRPARAPAAGPAGPG